MMQYTDVLSQFDAEWEQIPEDAGDNNFENLPDGKYQVKVNELNIQESKNSGRLQLFWDLVVVSGEYQGRHIFRYNGLESAENLKWLKKDLGRCGLNLLKVSDLPANLEKLLDIVVEVQLKTKGEYQNCYINKKLGIVGGAQEIPFSEDEFPFGG